MNQEGPTLEHLLRRLAETPSDFLAEPRSSSGRGTIHVPAVVADLLAFHGCGLTELRPFTPDASAQSLRRAGVTLLLCWLLADSEIIALKIPADALVTLLTEGASELASQNAAAKYRDRL